MWSVNNGGDDGYHRLYSTIIPKKFILIFANNPGISWQEAASYQIFFSVSEVRLRGLLFLYTKKLQDISDEQKIH
ncbi:hypothetical protein ECED1_2079 [Escherichia coli ED1a]|uniref:Uncharacterized protein n=1 Tax=Escherichia coli O81 (strain ED1a) TaxID=585397 RepID=B7MVQ8_ECO81|nr:hypothetical protein ECED1_2079 [Escherichia coli ED1a]